MTASEPDDDPDVSNVVCADPNTPLDFVLLYYSATGLLFDWILLTIEQWSLN